VAVPVKYLSPGGLEITLLTVLFSINYLGMIVLPIVVAFYFTRKFQLPWWLVFAGALTFIASQILHLPFLTALYSYLNNIGFSASSETMSAVINAIVAGLAAGIFEETARWVLYKFVLKNARTWKEGILVGAGHGGVEALLVGILGTLTFVNMLVLRNGDLAALGVPVEMIETARDQVAAFWSTPAHLAILGLVERIFAICLHLVLSVMVLYGVAYKKPIWYWAAIFWHSIVNAVPVYLLSSVDPLVIEGIVGVFALISLWIVLTMRPWFAGGKSGEPLPSTEAAR